MGFYSIRLDPADRAFSNYIRQKAGWKCQRCGKLCKIDGSFIARLEASHYFGRSHEAVRFDSENVYSLCGGCHKRMGGRRKDEKGEYDLWVKELLGQRRYDLLCIKAQTYKKKDRKMELLIIKEMMKELDESNMIKTKFHLTNREV